MWKTRGNYFSHNVANRTVWTLFYHHHWWLTQAMQNLWTKSLGWKPGLKHVYCTQQKMHVGSFFPPTSLTTITKVTSLAGQTLTRRVWPARLKSNLCILNNAHLHNTPSAYPRVVVRLGLNELCTNLPTRLLFPTPISCVTDHIKDSIQTHRLAKLYK